MRYIVLIMMLAVTQLGCLNVKSRRSANAPPPPPPKAGPENRSLSELAPQQTGPKSTEPPAKAPLPELSAPAKRPTPRPAPASGATYKIAKGDTYWSIAQRIYGDGKLWPRIKQANPGVDMDSLKVGQVIKIPSQ